MVIQMNPGCLVDRYRAWQQAMDQAASVGDWPAFVATWENNPSMLAGHPPTMRDDMTPEEIMSAWLNRRGWDNR